MPKLLWGLAFGPKAVAFFDSMPVGKLRAQVVKKAKALQLDPKPAGCKKLVGTKNGDEDVWRIRSGDYRVLYAIRENEVVVIDAGRLEAAHQIREWVWVTTTQGDRR